jgi:hypothetical protein
VRGAAGVLDRDDWEGQLVLGRRGGPRGVLVAVGLVLADPRRLGRVPVVAEVQPRVQVLEGV